MGICGIDLFGTGSVENEFRPIWDFNAIFIKI